MPPPGRLFAREQKLLDQMTEIAEPPADCRMPGSAG